MKFNSSLGVMLCLLATVTLFSCKKNKSDSTGWAYNDTKNGGFEKKAYKGQENGPNLVLIEGGTFMMGNTEQDLMYDWDHVPRRVSVSSFYMDETEVSNINYREYLYWIDRVFSEDMPEVAQTALPDTLVWRDELSFNEPFVEYYFRHPAYDDYPVVGISWVQANEYCKWRSDRVNEQILVDKGILETNPDQGGSDNFNTGSYLAGQYEGVVKKNLKDLNPKGSGERSVRFDDGIVLPSYRLPTEAEWEYAALALAGNQDFEKEEKITDRRIYPWNGTSVRFSNRNKYQGQIVANFMRGRGDYMGMAGKLNDNAEITAPVRAFQPNDYGLYNMAGNVSEWVLDVYRPMTNLDQNDLNSYRGNVYTTVEREENGKPVEKDSLGRLKYRTMTEEESKDRRNYQRADVINYMDGDEQSGAEYDSEGFATLVNDESRVYKGGSWADRAYYLSPGTRRFLDQNQSSAMIGFRCSMIRVGSPAGNNFKGGNQFKKKKKRRGQ